MRSGRPQTRSHQIGSSSGRWTKHSCWEAATIRKSKSGFETILSRTESATSPLHARVGSAFGIAFGSLSLVCRKIVYARNHALETAFFYDGNHLQRGSFPRKGYIYKRPHLQRDSLSRRITSTNPLLSPLALSPHTHTHLPT